jgi:putative FmdB family regulatory protein
MPTYVYHCDSCGARIEVWQKMTDDPLATCQTCGAPIHRVLYPAGIVFKGGGFYSTDHRSNGAKAAENGSDGSDGKAGEKVAATKSNPESKPATSTTSE